MPKDSYPVRWVTRQAVATLPEHIDVSSAGQIREEPLSVINRGAGAPRAVGLAPCRPAPNVGTSGPKCARHGGVTVKGEAGPAFGACPAPLAWAARREANTEHGPSLTFTVTPREVRI